MLIKTEVKRRAQAINEYIASLRTKLQNNRLKDAIQLFRISKDSINNSYMAPYDPNTYLLDSLKTKNQKLRKEKQMVDQLLMDKLEQINKIKMKKGFTYTNPNKNEENLQFITKMETSSASAYVSRLSLKLTDVDKIDYENITLETDFKIIRINVDHFCINIPYSKVFSIQSEDRYMLLNWENQKNSNSFLILKFAQEEERKFWSRCFNFCKLICESSVKQKLFYKQEQIKINVRQIQNQHKELKTQKQTQRKWANNGGNSKFLNLNTNKSSAYDRLRRKSQYYPAIGQNNSSFVNWAKLRKVSEDLTIKQANNRSVNVFDKKMTNQKSQKSFEDQNSVNSVRPKKQQTKKDSKFEMDFIGSLEDVKQKQVNEKQRQQMGSLKNNSQNSHSNKQIFFNQSSIHWIEEENQDAKSRSSIGKSVKKNLLSPDIVNNDDHMHDEISEHISEVPAQGEQSPLLPYNLRQKRRGKMDNSKFQVRVKEVPRIQNEKITVKSNKSNKSDDKNMKKNKKQKGSNSNSKVDHNEVNQVDNEFQIEEENNESNGQVEVQSINQQENDEQSEEKSNKKINKSNISVEDKSEDIVSQNENSQTQSRKYGLDDLKSGIVFLKCPYSGWSWNLQKKKLFLSNNDSQLCYKNERGDDLKKINLLDIQKIEYNKISPGIQKHIKDIQKSRCLSIRYKKKGEYKMLQFYLPQQDNNIQNLQNFYQKLKTYINFKKNHHQ